MATSSVPASSVPASTSTAAPSAPTSTSTVAGSPLLDFPETVIVLDGSEVLVALADTASLRQRGLMGVTDLGDVSGMLFTWGGDEVTSGFTMRDTLLPLEIGFFSPDGTLVDLMSMVPCTAEPCPVYRAHGSYAYAIEIPSGGGLSLTRESSLDVGP